MKGWLEGREQRALDMMRDDYDRIADKDTFFAKQNMVKWKADRWFKYTKEQQRLAVIKQRHDVPKAPHCVRAFLVERCM